MKKLLYVTIFIVTGLNAFCQDAFIEQLTGTVEIKHPGETAFKIAKNGDKLFNETIISTGFKSFAIVKVGSATLTVRPITILSLTEIQKSAGTETLNLSLRTGRVRMEVKPPAGMKTTATIKGPTTTASVRGTRFEFDTDNLYVIEGTVSYIGERGQNVLVRAGENSRLKQTGQVAYPRDGRNMDLMPPSLVGTSAVDLPASAPAIIGSTGFGVGIEFD